MKRPRSRTFREPQFVSRVSAKRIVCHEPDGDLVRQVRLEASPLIDGREFSSLELRIRLQLAPLPREVGSLSVRL